MTEINRSLYNFPSEAHDPSHEPPDGTFADLAHAGGLFSRLVSGGGFSLPARKQEEEQVQPVDA